MKSTISLGLILCLAGPAFPAAASEPTPPLNESGWSHIVSSTGGGAPAVTGSKQIVETVPRGGGVRPGTRVRSSKRVFWVAATVAAAGVVALWLLRVAHCNEQVC
jgi:hypothetical protein